MTLSRSTYIQTRIALAKQILANPWDSPARRAYDELKALYLAQHIGEIEESGVWRAALPAMCKKQAE